MIVTTDDQTLFPADHRGPRPPAGRPGGGPGSGDTGRATGGSPGAVLAGIGRVPASTAQRLACDGELTTVLLDPAGAVTGLRTERRFFTAAQRRAMIARDGDRCPWPGATGPATWSDGHHLVWATRGGPTTVANGALPCPGHHTMCHEGGWDPAPPPRRPLPRDPPRRAHPRTRTPPTRPTLAATPTQPHTLEATDTSPQRE